MSGPEKSRQENGILIGIFVLALLYHFYGVTFNWTMPYMSGHEFRQAHTAIVAYYIDQQDNFSLLYETPIFGKPWVSLLLEVPIYEWSVVLLSRASGLPHVVAARTITATCFYLMLPAIYLLLGRLAVPKPRRLLLLALVLTAPVYIYYSRAFLMDSMALMCSAWFLLGFVRTMDERRWKWLALTIVAGTGAALVKSAILAVWMIPGAAYGAWMLWRDVRARTGWVTPLKTILWGAATVAVALGSLRWWVAYTDPFKESHASAWIFTSKNLSLGNWGLFDFKVLFSAGIWRYFFGCWEQAVMSRWLIGLGLVAGLAFPAVRWRVLGPGSIFFLAQFLFPFAYAYQDYYYYACAVFLNVALGFMLLGLLDSRVPRWCCWLLVAVPFGAQLTTYWQGYRIGQSAQARGGHPFTDALRDLTPKGSVLVVAGADWAAMTPLYAQRKALMIRNGLEYDAAYLNRAFADLDDEDVSALVVYGPLRMNKNFINLAAAKFDLDGSAPTFSHSIADIYVRKLYLKGMQMRLRVSRSYPEITVPEARPGVNDSAGVFSIVPAVARTAFANVSPGPYQAQFAFGVDLVEREGKTILSAHPDSDLWLRAPADASQITWDFGIFPPAYEKAGDKTDGVIFMIEAETPDGQRRQIYHRLLDPVRDAADRGEQHEEVPYTPLPGETLQFSSRPNGNYAYDWTYWVRIEVN